MRPLYESVKEDKSKADKMFEDIGYNKYEYNDRIEYLSKEGSHEIAFYTDRKMIASRCGIGSEYITMQELQAINKKCKELKWI